MKHLTMHRLFELGFEVVKSYTHDNFMTQKRRKGCITIETTWRSGGVYDSQMVQIDDGEWRTLEPEEIVKLDKILNK